MNDSDKVETGLARNKLGMSTNIVFLEFSPATNTYIPVSRQFNDGVWKRETILDFNMATKHFNPMVTIQEAVGMAKSAKISQDDIDVNLHIPTLRKDHESLKLELREFIENHSENAKFNNKYLIGKIKQLDTKIDKYFSQMLEFQKMFDKKNKEANKLIEKHEEIQKLIDEATPFEKEIAKLRKHSDEWLISTGYAIRHLKGEKPEKIYLPFKLCPFCCQPVEQTDTPKKDLITLTYKGIIKERAGYSHNKYHGSNYLTYLPDEGTGGEEIEVTLPLSLWNQCKKIEHDDWHNRFMNRYIESQSKKVKESGGNDIKRGEIKFRADNIDNWFADIKMQLPGGKNKGPSKQILRQFASLFFNNKKTPFDKDDFKRKITNRRKGKDCKISKNTIDVHLSFLTGIGAIKHNKEKDVWQFNFDTSST